MALGIEGAIYSKLSLASGVTALLGDPPRFYPGQAPQSDPLPVAIYNQTHRKQHMSLTGPINLVTYVQHIEVYAATYAEAEAVYLAIRDELIGFMGEITNDSGTVKVKGIFEESGSDSLESPIHANEEGIHQAGLDLKILFSL